MAENLIDQILDRYHHLWKDEFKSCSTAETPLVGGKMADFSSYLEAQSLGIKDRWVLSLSNVEHLIQSNDLRFFFD